MTTGLSLHDPDVCRLDGGGVSPTCPACIAGAARLGPAAGVLLGLLQRGPRTWRALAEAGLSREVALLAAGEIVDVGDVRIRVGPLLLELEGPA